MTGVLVSATDLHDMLGDPSVVVVDCRFSLADASLGFGIPWLLLSVPDPARRGHTRG